MHWIFTGREGKPHYLWIKHTTKPRQERTAGRPLPTGPTEYGPQSRPLCLEELEGYRPANRPDRCRTGQSE